MTRGRAVRFAVVLVSVMVLAALVPVPRALDPLARLGAGVARAADPDRKFVDGFLADPAVAGLDQPTAVRFASDGRVFVAEKRGVVQVFDSIDDPTPSVFADLRSQVYDFWDRGLLGLALAPSFPTDPHVYVLYTYDHILGDASPAPKWSDDCPDPPGYTTAGCVASARLSRLTAAGNTWTGSEQVLIEDWCQQFPSHSIGTITFGADGYLYAGGGESANYSVVDYGQFGSPKNPCGDPPTGSGGDQKLPTAEGGSLRAQDIRTPGDPTGLDGTIIRVDPVTGAGAPGNPNAASTDANARRIVAHGVRNPFRFTTRPGTSELWIGDVGWVDYEEIDRIASPTAGLKNLGWPCYEGPNKQGGWDAANADLCETLYSAPGAATAPYYSYARASSVVAGDGCPVGGASVSGVAFYNGGSYPTLPQGTYPAKYDGALFFEDYTRGCMWAMLKGANGLPDPTKVEAFGNHIGPAIDLQVGPNGDLYYVDIYAGEIERIRYYPGNRPPTASATATPGNGPAPLTVTFNGSGSSDPDHDPITYAWDLDGDGAFDDGSNATATFTYTTIGTVPARLRVTDTFGATGTTSVPVSVGNTPPSVAIASPSASATWKVGDRINFSGSATDTQDGALPAANLVWTLVIRHCPNNLCHSHTVESFNGVASGSFVAPDHEYPSHLELHLRATDSGGLSTERQVDLYPRTTTITLQSTPNGLYCAIGAGSAPAPFTTTVIQGSTNTISAPAQSSGGQSYDLDSWSDGGAQSHEVVAGVTPSTYTATFSPRVVTVGAVSVNEGNTGTRVASVTLSRLGPYTQPRTVSYSTGDGSATAPADYVATSGNVTFGVGEATKTISVIVNGDALDEADETVTVRVVDTTTGTPRTSTGALTILDDDATPVAVPGAATIVEGDLGPRTIAIPVTLSARSGRTVTVDYRTVDAGATAPSDYTADIGTLTFAPGQTAATISITIRGDTTDEDDEPFLVALANPANATIGGFLGLGVGWITDDDPPPRVVGGAAAVVEGDLGTSTLSIPVTLSAPSGKVVRVPYATADLSASAPADYTARSGTLVFAPGQTVTSIDVTVARDTLDEIDEVLLVGFGPPTNATVGGLGFASGLVVDDDPSPILGVGSVSVTEGNSGTKTATVALTLGRVSGRTVTATYSTLDAGATAGSDYVATYGAVSFAPGETRKTVTVTIKGDSLVEGDEIVIVAVGNLVGAVPGYFGLGSVTILNDD